MDEQLGLFEKYSVDLDIDFENYLKVCKDDEDKYNSMGKKTNERSGKYFEDSLEAFRAMKTEIDKNSSYEKYL